MPRPIRIVPLGGLGEIGLNCLALEYEDRLLVIDAGLMFPDPATMPGVDLVIPDFTWLRERAEHLSALVLTHGHEDHIGAAGFLFREIGRSIPVIGTRLTLALARERLREARVEPELIEIEPRQKLTVGPFDLEFIGVNHSILDGVGLAVATPWGAVIHTGDFRMDQAEARTAWISSSSPNMEKKGCWPFYPIPPTPTNPASPTVKSLWGGPWNGFSGKLPAGSYWPVSPLPWPVYGRWPGQPRRPDAK